MTRGSFLFCCVLLAAAVCCGVTAYPFVFFGSSYVHKNLTLYTHEAFRENPDKFLAAIYDKISSDDFYDEAQKFEVYLAGSRREYVLLAPFCAKEPSCAHPISDKVFVAAADPEKNLAYGPGAEGPGRALDRVIIHELVKTQIKNKLGFLDYAILSDWRKEGYAEHVAMETRELPPDAFCGGAPGTDPALPYLKNRLMVEMLAAEDSRSYPSLMTTNYSYEGARSRVERQYCHK
ncbi:MAG: hypothetical protein WCW52_02185 [Elusimicrobiales bacterium]|jgi:hypothetical protein